MIINEQNVKTKTYHLSLSFAPAENVELFSTSPISSRQKLKLFIVHMYENFTTLTYNQMTHHAKCHIK